MKAMKRLFTLCIAILFLCVSLAACAPQQEEVSELDLIKAEWQRYVVDRTENVTEIQILGASYDSNLNFIEDKAIIEEILDILETLEISHLRLLEDAPSETVLLLTPLNVILIPQESDNGSISIHLQKDGEAYLNVVLGDSVYWAYASEWYKFDEIREYK